MRMCQCYCVNAYVSMPEAIVLNWFTLESGLVESVYLTFGSNYIWQLAF